jgi:hypothetical protein
MVGLADWICRVTEMIRAPEQAGLHHRHVPFAIPGVAFESWIGGFMNYGNDPFAFHPDEIGPHQIVVRHVYHAVRSKGKDRQRVQQKQNAQDRQFHHRKIPHLSVRSLREEFRST